VRRLNQHSVRFVIEPTIRIDRLEGDQATFSLADPSGNVFEFKAILATQYLSRERIQSLGRWTLWAILTTLVVCWIFLKSTKSSYDDSAGNERMSARAPACESVRGCFP
jgi:hypothetical protein